MVGGSHIEEEDDDGEQPTGNLIAHERICSMRYRQINARLRRMEHVLLWGAGTLIMGLATAVGGLVMLLLARVH